MNQPLQIFGTFGPTCHTRTTLEKLLSCGMTGLRYNLSHGRLQDNAGWFDQLDAAQQATKKTCLRLMDLQGREYRTGNVTLTIEKGKLYPLSQLALPAAVTAHLNEGTLLNIGDACLEMAVKENENQLYLYARNSGTIEPRRSFRIQSDNDLPVISESDLQNLKEAARFGISGVMIPFVQNGHDVAQVRQAVAPWLPHALMYAKIESMEGVRNIDSIASESDMIVIARGDLAAACGLEWLGAVQDYLEQACHRLQAPYMIVTQMLESMRHDPVCTRPEAVGIYDAVKKGASAIMLTGETALSDYPVEAMEFFCRTAAHACQIRNDPASLTADLLSGCTGPADPA